MLILFLNDVDLQLILEFENNFDKNCPVFPKNPKDFFCLVRFWTISFAKIDGPVTFLLYDLEC